MSPQNEAKKVHDTFISKQDTPSTRTRAHTQAWSSYSKAVVSDGCVFATFLVCAFAVICPLS